MDSPLNHMTFNGTPHIANPLRRPTVRTQAGLDTRVFEPVADVVNRCGLVLDPGNGRFQIRCNLIHTDHQDHLLGAEGHRRNPVAHSVQVDQPPIKRDCIGAGNHDVSCQPLTTELQAFIT